MLEGRTDADGRFRLERLPVGDAWVRAYVPGMPFAETRCHECRKHTRYEFTLLRRRLCESCERGHPHTYGLVNSMQLSFECSEFGRLLASERAHVLRSLPSIKIHNYDWFQRGAVTDKARAMLREVEASSRQVSRPIFPTRHPPFSLHITGFFFSI